MRVGIVGCGYMGEIHAELLRKTRVAEVVGVVDRDLPRARELAARLGIDTAYDELADFLRAERPDAVHILTPPMAHCALTCEAMAAGSHVFVEKPMAMSATEARQMVEVARKFRRVLAVGHNHLFDPVIAETARRVSEGQIGVLVGASIFHNSMPITAPWILELPSGPWFNDADHLLYLSDRFLGPIRNVRPVATTGPGGGGYRELHVAAENERGWSSLTYSTSTAPFEIRLVLYGSKRTLEVDVMSAVILVRRQFDLHRWLRKGVMALDLAAQLAVSTGWNAVQVLSGREDSWTGLRGLIRAFYEEIGRGGGEPVDLDNCVRVIELKEEIVRALEP